MPRVLGTANIHFAIIFFLLSARFLRTQASEFSTRLGYLPDDAFYYLVLAKNHAATGVWSFDGHSATSGFHLLWAYLISAIYQVWPEASLDLVYRILAVLGIFLTSASGALLVKPITERLGPYSTLAIPMILLGGVISASPFFGVETPLVLFFAALVARLCLTTRPATPAIIAGAALAAFLGELSRSDFALFPAALLAAAWLARFAQNDLAPTRPAFAAFGGACIGLMVGLLHNYDNTGTLVQSSAQMKAHWSALQGHSLAPTLFLLNLILSGIAGVVAIVAAFALLAAPRALATRPYLLPLVAAALAIIGYLAFYRFNSAAMQPWYAASFAIPLILALAVTLGTASKFIPATLLIAGASAYSLWGFLQWSGPVWTAKTHQSELGSYIASNSEIERVGTWNAGLIGFYAEGKVINLDGLVNADIYERALTDELAAYLIERQIGWIADFEAMFSPDMAIRGGYAGAELMSCLTPWRNFTNGEALGQWRGTDLILYRLDLSCLRRNIS